MTDSVARKPLRLWPGVVVVDGVAYLRNGEEAAAYRLP